MPRTGTEADVSESNLARLATEVEKSGIPWLDRLRESALDRFETLGLPSTREEEWRHTNVAPIAATTFTRASASGGAVSKAELSALALAELGCPRIVMVNGRHAPDLSEVAGLPSGIQVESLAAVLRSRPDEIEPHFGNSARFEDRAFTALNTASFEDGAVITVAPGAMIETPIHVLYLTAAAGVAVVSHPRTLVVVGDNAQASLIESYQSLGDGAYLHNAVTEVTLGQNARLDHVHVQSDGPEAFHIGSIQSLQARDSRWTQHNISFGAKLARHDVGSVLGGEGAEATLNGLYLAVGDQHVDNHTVLVHAKPHCPSHEVYKGILSGHAQAVFNGRIVVRPDAQKTDAKQSNKNMLLTDDAMIHTRPQLEIYADDVKCTHGATIGRLQEEELFYLRARGIGLAEARSILIHGFVGEIFDKIAFDPLRERLAGEALTIMARELGSGEER
jgi:Fe-S cluster assembly protein SufD